MSTCTHRTEGKKDSLLGLDGRQDSLLVVKGSIGVREGRTLREGDGDTGVLEGTRGRDEREGDGDERSFAEHGEEKRATKGQ